VVSLDFPVLYSEIVVSEEVVEFAENLIVWLLVVANLLEFENYQVDILRVGIVVM
jgi:hypothetical protein